MQKKETIKKKGKSSLKGKKNIKTKSKSKKSFNTKSKSTKLKNTKKKNIKISKIKSINNLYFKFENIIKSAFSKNNKKTMIKYSLIEKKRKSILTIALISLCSIIFLVLIYKIFFVAPNLSITDVYLDGNKVIVTFKNHSSSLKNNVYCLYTDSSEKPSIDDSKWFLTENNECTYTLDKNIYHVYLKNEDNTIIRAYQTDRIGAVKNLTINIDKYYLPLNDTLELNIKYMRYGYVDDNVKWYSSNTKIATVENGKVKGLSNGNVKITANINGYSVTSDITVTNLISKRVHNKFSTNKKDLPCEKYSKKENILLDEILEFKINNVGYKTRAAAVEAARFLTLDFPYRINYFYENGRLSTNKVDGEGRYYHKGLYLNESKYKNISKSKYGPKIWGCPLYSVPDSGESENGLDCSGFVSWVLKNAGFNPGDIGAGITSKNNLTDLGNMKKLTSSLAKSKTIKVGDLLHNNWNGGHIAIIIGIDKKYYYVAQSIWFDEGGVTITKYKKDELNDDFDEVILMDKYYKKDGSLTKMW